MAEVFPTVLRDPIEDTNTLLIGSEAPRPATGCADAGARRCRRTCGAIAGARSGADRAAPAGRRGLHRRRAPVEWLIDRSILGYAADD